MFLAEKFFISISIGIFLTTAMSAKELVTFEYFSSVMEQDETQRKQEVFQKLDTLWEQDFWGDYAKNGKQEELQKIMEYCKNALVTFPWTKYLKDDRMFRDFPLAVQEKLSDMTTMMTILSQGMDCCPEVVVQFNTFLTQIKNLHAKDKLEAGWKFCLTETDLRKNRIMNQKIKKLDLSEQKKILQEIILEEKYLKDPRCAYYVNAISGNKEIYDCLRQDPKSADQVLAAITNQIDRIRMAPELYDSYFMSFIKIYSRLASTADVFSWLNVIVKKDGISYQDRRQIEEKIKSLNLELQ